MSNAADKVSDLGKTLRELKRRITDLDERIDVLADEREEIRTAPLAREEAVAALDEQFKEWKDRGRREIARQVRDVAVGRKMDFPALVREANPGRYGQVRPEVLLALLAEPLRKSAISELDSLGIFSEKSLPTAERERRVEEIDAEIEELERQRGQLLSELRVAGFVVSEGVEEIDILEEPCGEILKPLQQRTVAPTPAEEE